MILVRAESCKVNPASLETGKEGIEASIQAWQLEKKNLINWNLLVLYDF